MTLKILTNFLLKMAKITTSTTEIVATDSETHQNYAITDVQFTKHYGIVLIIKEKKNEN